MSWFSPRWRLVCWVAGLSLTAPSFVGAAGLEIPDPAVAAWRQLTEELTRIQGRARLIESVWKEGREIEAERTERMVEFAAWGSWLRVEVQGKKSGGRVAAAVNSRYGFTLAAEPGRDYAITSLTRVPPAAGEDSRVPADYEFVLDNIVRAFLLAPSHLAARPLHEVVLSSGFRLTAEPQPLPEDPDVLRIRFEYQPPGGERLPPEERPLPLTDSWLDVEPQRQWRLRGSDCGVEWGRIRGEIEYFPDGPHRPRRVVQRLLNPRTGRERRTEFLVETFTIPVAADEQTFKLSGFGLPESAASRVLTDAPDVRSRSGSYWALVVNVLVVVVVLAVYVRKRLHANHEPR